jgi:hypothetical protein
MVNQPDCEFGRLGPYYNITQLLVKLKSNLLLEGREDMIEGFVAPRLYSILSLLSLENLR